MESDNSNKNQFLAKKRISSTDIISNLILNKNNSEKLRIKKEEKIKEINQEFESQQKNLNQEMEKQKEDYVKIIKLEEW